MHPCTQLNNIMYTFIFVVHLFFHIYFVYLLAEFGNYERKTFQLNVECKKKNKQQRKKNEENYKQNNGKKHTQNLTNAKYTIHICIFTYTLIKHTFTH